MDFDFDFDLTWLVDLFKGIGSLFMKLLSAIKSVFSSSASEVSRGAGAAMHTAAVADTLKDNDDTNQKFGPNEAIEHQIQMQQMRDVGSAAVGFAAGASAQEQAKRQREPQRGQPQQQTQQAQQPAPTKQQQQPSEPVPTRGFVRELERGDFGAAATAAGQFFTSVWQGISGQTTTDLGAPKQPPPTATPARAAPISRTIQDTGGARAPSQQTQQAESKQRSGMRR